MRTSTFAKPVAPGPDETYRSSVATARPVALRRPSFQTALEIQFQGVENLIRALDGLTWTRGRRRR